MSSHSKCPECEGRTVYRHAAVPANGGHGPRLLPGLGRLFSSAKVTILVCANCGLTRLYAEQEAREKLDADHGWTQVT